MKKMAKILAISMMSVLLLSGTLVGFGSAYEGKTFGFWKNHLNTWAEGNGQEPLCPYEGKTFGFWKNHLNTWAEGNGQEPLCPYEGNTPGFWKNHLDEWVGYTPDQLVDEVFDIPDGIVWYILIGSKTLLQALQFHGGPGFFGKARNLLRAAVAGLLNDAHPEVNYIYTYGDLQWLVNYPLSSGDRGAMEYYKNLIDDQNNLGSDL